MPLGVTFRSMSAASTLVAGKKIASQSLGVAAASISFTGIDTTYKMFRVTAYLVKDGSNGRCQVRLNNDSGANYTRQNLTGDNAGVTAARSAQTNFEVTLSSINNGTPASLSFVVAKQLAGSPAMLIASAVMTNTAPVLVTNYTGGIWANTTDLISRIDLVASAGNFSAGTVAVLEAC